MSPRVVIGAPVFGKAAYLPSAIESLLAQTFPDFALVLIDDGSPDDSLAIARRLAEQDPRVHVMVNEQRLGMLGNTRRAFDLPREMFPDAEFWALGSDHDIWDPTWLEKLVAAHEADPRTVLAYSLTRRIDEHGEPYPTTKPQWRFDSREIADRRERMRRSFRGMAAGDMIYGLFRAEALARVGTYQPVLVPDRLLLSELALHGTFVQVLETLWYRRFRGLAELQRQRQAFFLDRIPRYTHLPWWQTHVALMFWQYAVRGKGTALGIGRAEGARLAVDYLDVSVRHRLWRRRRRWRNRVVRARNAVLGPPVKALLRSARFQRLARHRVIPAMAEAEDVLKRLVH